MYVVSTQIHKSKLNISNEYIPRGANMKKEYHQWNYLSHNAFATQT